MSPIVRIVGVNTINDSQGSDSDVPLPKVFEPSHRQYSHRHKIQLNDRGLEAGERASRFMKNLARSSILSNS